MKYPTRIFRLSPDTPLDVVLAALRERFFLRAESGSECLHRYFDSFDGLLYAAESVFYHERTNGASRLLWERLGDETPSFVLAAPEAPRFAAELPPGRFRDTLAPVLGLRALLPLVEVRCRRRVLRLLNADEKTTARLIIEEDAVASDPDSDARSDLGVTLSVAPVKGYDQAYRTLCAFVHQELGLPDLDAPALLDALQAIGRAPGDPAKVDLALHPELRADEAVKRILLTLLYKIEVNEYGTRADLDIEFLHDFRVSVRRTRSVLGQLKSVFPASVLEHFGPAFKWLGGITGPTRDLDVYLLKFEAYQGWLPPSVRADLAPLRDFLRLQQQAEQARMVAAMDEPRYRALLNAWRAYLEEPVPPVAPSADAARPVLEVASERIWRAYRKVLKEGNAIVHDPHAPAEKLHRLRITCKKLRYLLEMFRSLYPAQAIKQSISELKRLQDNLGDFNDFAVQQEKLTLFARDMMARNNTPVATYLAMGRLEEHLQVLQRETRTAFTERFLAFAAPKNRQHFKTLFR